MKNTRSHTGDHEYVEFANPYMRCDLCRGWVTAWHNPQKCRGGRCTERHWNAPCDCGTGALSACPSWSPVDGCTCEKQLGRVEHGRPPARTEAAR